MRTGDRIPDLAVIIPAHNEAAGLGGCLRVFAWLSSPPK